MKKDIELWGYDRKTWDKFTITLDELCKTINSGEGWSDDEFVYATKGERNIKYDMERSQYLKENSISNLLQREMSDE